MVREKGRLRQGRSNEALGVMLILIGVLFFVGQWFDFHVGQYGWPFFIIVPGVLLLRGGFFTGEHNGGVILPLGSAATSVGLILFFQNVTDLWATWAYAWALIPAAVGLGLLAHGLVHDREESVRTGTRVLTIGLVLFAIGAFFFEVIIGLSGFGLARGWLGDLWPLLLIAAGMLLLVRNFFQGERV